MSKRKRQEKESGAPAPGGAGGAGTEGRRTVILPWAEHVERSAAPAPVPAPAVPRLSIEKLERRLHDLVSEQAPHPDQDLIEEMLLSSLRLARDGASRAELKILSATLRDLRYAFKVFRPHAHKRKITVFGSARLKADTPEYEQARRFAAEVVRRGFMVITGAGGGIMEAAQEGAGREASFGMNIRLPFEQNANRVILGDPKLVYFRYFFTRKLCFLREASAVALFPGGFGTHDECFETLTLVQTGKASLTPLVFVDRKGGTYWREWADYLTRHLLRPGMISEEDLALFKITDDPDWAADEISRFYRRYHSSRFVRDQLVLRLLSPLSAGTVERLNQVFKSLLARPEGRIVAGEALPEEGDQPELAALPRLVLPFNRRDWGKLRQMIDVINQE